MSDDPRAPDPAPRPQRLTLGRRILFIGLAAGLLVLLLEALSFAAFLPLDGNLFSYSRIRARKQALSQGFETDAQGRPDPYARLGFSPHPYVGFLWDDAVPLLYRHRVRYGLHDPDASFPERSPDRFLIGVLGGSVANSLANQPDNPVIGEFAAHPELQGKEILLINLAMPAFKQPQQLMALIYAQSLGAEFDIVINLDGLNELSFVGHHEVGGHHPAFPANWPELTESMPDLELQRRLGRLVHDRLGRQEWAHAFSGTLTRWSITLQLIWKLRDRSLENRVNESLAEMRAARAAAAQRESGRSRLDAENVRSWVVENWKRCSLLIHRACQADGIRYFHFLQPDQYVEGSKPMGEEEKRIALASDHTRQAVRTGYPLLLERGRQLQAAGVDFRDLRMVFADVHEQIYVDQFCHVNRRGNEILARHIANEVLGPAAMPELVSIECEERSIRLDDPLHETRIRIRGRSAGGATYDLTHPRTGTVYSSENPDIVSVSEYGRLRAHRRGRSTIRVENGPHELQLSVAADWPRVLEATPGVAGSGGFVPRLELSTGGDALGVRITSALGGAGGVLFLSTPPLLEGTAVRGLPEVILPVPVRARGEEGKHGVGHLQVDLPLQAVPGLDAISLYMAAFFQDAGTVHGWSATNGLVVSPGR